MKNKKNIFLRTTMLLGLVLVCFTACEREVSEEVKFATFTTNPAVFLDGFSGGLEYLPFQGSKLDAFTVDTEVK